MRERSAKSNIVLSSFPVTSLETPLQDDVTQLLQAWSAGDNSVQDQLWPIVYVELNRLARRYLRNERRDHTLQTGALVNEAFLKLVDWKNAEWQNRAHFFGMCARVMRQILVDHARSRAFEKRGGDRRKISLDEFDLAQPLPNQDLIALDDALKRLSSMDPRKASVVEMRFFAGMSFEEAAAALGVSRLTAIRDWNFARAWLCTELRE